MSPQTISVKFADRTTQARRLQRLEEFCGQLVHEGVATRLTVRAVFPGHADPLRAKLFTIEVDGASTDLSPRFMALPTVEFAQSAPQRRALLKTG